MLDICIMNETTKNLNLFSTQLLEWYHLKGRFLPWRENIAPYPVWLAEIMLQQTTVATVKDYYARFLEKFPTIQDLAAADEEEVLHLWQGLGYYSRARNLHKCAQNIVCERGGVFPNTEKELLTLPGIGPYTAAAIAAIAFKEPATVVDGNVERIISRLYRIEEKLPKSRPLIKERAQALTSSSTPDHYAQAIMDLGATICTPKSPKCDVCPVSGFCQAYKEGDMLDYPKKEPKKAKLHKTGTLYIFEDAQGNLYKEKRPEKGLLANLWQFPSTGWEQEQLPEELEQLLYDHEAEDIGTYSHVFTHFKLTFDVKHIKLAETMPWDYENKPIPTLMKKALTLLKNNLH